MSVTGLSFRRVASNTQRAAYLEESSSIRAALELLSDKEPGESQPSLPDIETERAAKEKAEREARQKAEEVLSNPHDSLQPLGVISRIGKNLVSSASSRCCPLQRLRKFAE